MQRAAVVAGWVRSENVSALMTWLSFFIDYAYDDSDWQAVEAALPGTDADNASGCYDYPLMGTPPLTVWLAQNVGADPVSVRVEGDMDVVLAATVETLVSVLVDVGRAR